MLVNTVSISMIRSPHFEQRAVACPVRTVEDHRLEKAGQKRETHRADVLRQRVRDVHRLLRREEGVVLRPDERVADRLGQSAADHDLTKLVFQDVAGLSANVARGQARQ